MYSNIPATLVRYLIVITTMSANLGCMGQCMALPAAAPLATLYHELDTLSTQSQRYIRQRDVPLLLRFRSRYELPSCTYIRLNGQSLTISQDHQLQIEQFARFKSVDQFLVLSRQIKAHGADFVVKYMFKLSGTVIDAGNHLHQLTEIGNNAELWRKQGASWKIASASSLSVDMSLDGQHSIATAKKLPVWAE